MAICLISPLYISPSPTHTPPLPFPFLFPSIEYIPLLPCSPSLHYHFPPLQTSTCTPSTPSSFFFPSNKHLLFTFNSPSLSPSLQISSFPYTPIHPLVYYLPPLFKLAHGDEATKSEDETSRRARKKSLVPSPTHFSGRSRQGYAVKTWKRCGIEGPAAKR